MSIIKEIHSEAGQWSSKRVYGGILILTVILLAVFNQSPAIAEPMLYTGAGLLGLGTVANIVKATKGK